MTEFHEIQNNSMRNPTEDRYPTAERVEHFRPKLAGFWIRFWAYSIDLIVLYAVAGILVKPSFRIMSIPITNPPFLFFTPYKITMLIVLFLYFILMTNCFQQTIGKMILGIKVIPKADGKLTWGTLFFREVVGRFISKTLLIPYLLVAFMPKKEALHDLFADTYVVHESAFERRMYGGGHYLNNHRGEQLQEGPLV